MLKVNLIVALGLSTLALLAACADSDHDYAHANAGHTIIVQPQTQAPQQPQAPMQAQETVTRTYDPGRNTETVMTTRTTAPLYNRAGYYDPNGDFMGSASALSVPARMMPPQGYCRLWYPDRSPDSQPDVQGCGGIQSHVADGGYVLYGG